MKIHIKENFDTPELKNNNYDFNKIVNKSKGIDKSLSNVNTENGLDYTRLIIDGIKKFHKIYNNFTIDSISRPNNKTINIRMFKEKKYDNLTPYAQIDISYNIETKKYTLQAYFDLFIESVDNDLDSFTGMSDEDADFVTKISKSASGETLPSMFLSLRNKIIPLIEEFNNFLKAKYDVDILEN